MVKGLKIIALSTLLAISGEFSTNKAAKAQYCQRGQISDDQYQYPYKFATGIMSWQWICLYSDNSNGTISFMTPYGGLAKGRWAGRTANGAGYAQGMMPSKFMTNLQREFICTRKGSDQYGVCGTPLDVELFYTSF